MKKVMALLLTLSMVLGFASCAKKVEVPSKSDVKKAAAEEYDMDFKVDSEEISDDEKDAEWVLVSKDGTTTETEAPTTTTTEATTTESESSENGGSETNANPNPTGAKYVNFDEMNFYINGKKYTLGKTTLQELVDDGVPFAEGESENFGNNVKSHYQSGYIKIDCGTKNGNYFWIEVFNDTDSGKPMNECYVNQILFKILNDEGAKQTLVTFDFPFTLTMDELKANSGEPTEKPYHNETGSNVYDKLEWTKKGTKFMNRNRDEFSFKNGAFSEVDMTYIP